MLADGVAHATKHMLTLLNRCGGANFTQLHYTKFTHLQVLADGVAHATKHLPNLDLVVDMATLTGLF